MLVRSLAAAALLALGAASPALAQSAVDPARVLAGKAHPRAGQGFADRTARISSIMGTDMSTAAPLHLPTKPVWTRAPRREADASAGLR